MSFKDIANYLFKEPKVALRLRLLFVQGDEAKSLFQIKPQYSEMLSTELVAMFDVQEQFSLVRSNHFYKFWSDLKRNKGVAMGHRILLASGAKTMVSEGAVVYKDWKLNAWLTGEETQAANWLLKKTHAIIVVKDGANSYTYQVTKLKTKITPQVKDGKVSFAVKVTTDGMILEESGREIDFSKEGNLQKVGRLFGQIIKQQLDSAIYKSQRELKIDYLGFGKAFKQNRPQDFEKLHWETIYPTVPIKVEVNAKVSSSGLQT